MDRYLWRVAIVRGTVFGVGMAVWMPLIDTDPRPVFSAVFFLLLGGPFFGWAMAKLARRERERECEAIGIADLAIWQQLHDAVRHGELPADATHDGQLRQLLDRRRSKLSTPGRAAITSVLIVAGTVVVALIDRPAWLYLTAFCVIMAPVTNVRLRLARDRMTKLEKALDDRAGHRSAAVAP